MYNKEDKNKRFYHDEGWLVLLIRFKDLKGKNK